MGINRIRLEFKDRKDQNRKQGSNGINRIRLEFKGGMGFALATLLIRINRIRLEFKELPILSEKDNPFVLIESDWNLKLSSKFVESCPLAY